MSSSGNQILEDVAHPDFLLAQQLVYEPNGLEANNIRIAKESADYGSLDVRLNGKICKFRFGKLTPKKVGFFITITTQSPQVWNRPYCILNSKVKGIG